MTGKIRKDLERLIDVFKIEDYNDYVLGKISFTDLLIKYNSTEYLFNLLFKSLNLQKRRKIIEENTRHDFFDCIDTEIKAYLLGFYYADGSLNAQRKRIRISIDFNDIEIINLFREYIAPLNVIGEYFKSKEKKNKTKTHLNSIQIYSPHIVETLTKYGMGHRKTYNDIADLSFIQDNVMRHFIRGYFDGDGCVYYHKGKKKCKLKNAKIKEYEYTNRLWYIISYTKPHLVIIQNWLYRNGIKANVYNDGRDNYILSVTKKDSFFKLRDLLYNNSNFFLKRKRDKFMLIY